MTRYIRCPFGVFELRPRKRPILWEFSRGKQTYATCVDEDDDKHHDWTVADVICGLKVDPSFRKIPTAEATKAI